MGHLLNTPEAWETLDLRADVIGRRTMKSGRQSIMTRQPLFFLARSVVQQVNTALGDGRPNILLLCKRLWKESGNNFHCSTTFSHKFNVLPEFVVVVAVVVVFRLRLFLPSRSACFSALYPSLLYKTTKDGLN